MSPAAREKGFALLLGTSKLARFELFAHTVQENILTHEVDYVTLGWTRLLHVALDLVPSEQMDELLPRFIHLIATLIIGPLPATWSKHSCFLRSHREMHTSAKQ